MGVPRRRIDDRLRDLCAKALVSSDGELKDFREEFLALLREKLERLEKHAARFLLNGQRLEPERRSTDVKEEQPKSYHTLKKGA